MDAIIMEGTRMKAGAVTAVTKVANPVTLARRIMEQVIFIIKSDITIFACFHISKI